MHHRKVLVVEDDIALSEEVAEILQEQGYCVKFARTLLQFEKKISEGEFDLFILDLLLPDGHGHEIIRKIRASSPAGILVLSGKMDELDKVVSLELGADDYVVKPFSRSELSARVKSLLRRMDRQSAPSESLQTSSGEVFYGEWRTDVNARKLFAPSGEAIRLTKLEFDLWWAFLNGLDRVLTREQLIYAIRGRDWAGYDRSIDGLVSRLRKKLSADEGIDENFETIRGVGYLLRSITGR